MTNKIDKNSWLNLSERYQSFFSYFKDENSSNGDRFLTSYFDPSIDDTLAYSPIPLGRITQMLYFNGTACFFNFSLIIEGATEKILFVTAGNTKGGSITVPLTSCLTCSD
jgi:hypothetical protein